MRGAIDQTEVPAAADADAGYGGFALGAMRLALPMGALREAVPCRSLIAIPCPEVYVIGGIALRGVLVPVIDLDRLLGRAAGARAPRIIVVMEHGGKILGIGADEISNVYTGGGFRVDPAAAPGGPAGLFAGSFQPPGVDEPISVLSPSALAAAAAAAMVTDFEPQRRIAVEETPGPGSGRVRSQVLLVRTGRTLLAIDALAVHSTLSSPRIETTYLSRGHCLGVIDYLGSKIPAIDLAGLCGFCPPGQRERLQAFILSMEAGMVACLVEEVLDVVGVDRADVLALSDGAQFDLDLFTGVLPTACLSAELLERRRIAGTQFFLIDGAALKACADIDALSRTNTRTREPASTAAKASGAALAGDAGRSIVTFDYGVEAAAPLDQVVEILPYAPPQANLDRDGTLIGMLISRGRAIPVVCLGSVLGLAASQINPITSVLVVDTDGAPVGFAVAVLSGIEPAARESTLGPHSAREVRRMVEIEDRTGQRRLLRLLDLAQLAADIRGRTAPAMDAAPRRASA